MGCGGDAVPECPFAFDVKAKIVVAGETINVGPLAQACPDDPDVTGEAGTSPLGEAGEAVTSVTVDPREARASISDVDWSVGDGWLRVTAARLAAVCTPGGKSIELAGLNVEVGGTVVPLPRMLPAPNTIIPLKADGVEVGTMTLNRQTDMSVTAVVIELLPGAEGAPVSGVFELVTASCCPEGGTPDPGDGEGEGPEPGPGDGEGPEPGDGEQPTPDPEPTPDPKPEPGPDPKPEPEKPGPDPEKPEPGDGDDETPPPTDPDAKCPTATIRAVSLDVLGETIKIEPVPSATPQKPVSTLLDVDVPGMGHVGEEVAKVDVEAGTAEAYCTNLDFNIGEFLKIGFDWLRASCGPDGFESDFLGLNVSIAGHDVKIPATPPPNTGIELVLPTPGPLPDVKIGELTLNKQEEGRITGIFVELLEEIPGSPLSGRIELVMVDCCDEGGGEPAPKPEPEPTPEPEKPEKPEPEKPKPEPEPTPKPEKPKPEPKPTPDPEPKPEKPKPEKPEKPKPEPKPEKPAPDPKPKPEPDPKPEKPKPEKPEKPGAGGECGDNLWSAMLAADLTIGGKKLELPLVPKATVDNPNASAIDIEIPGIGKVGQEKATVDIETGTSKAECFDIEFSIADVLTIGGDVWNVSCSPTEKVADFGSLNIEFMGKKLDFGTEVLPNTTIPLITPVGVIGKVVLNHQTHNSVTLIHIEGGDLPGSPIVGSIDMVTASCCPEKPAPEPKCEDRPHAYGVEMAMKVAGEEFSVDPVGMFAAKPGQELVRGPNMTMPKVGTIGTFRNEIDIETGYAISTCDNIDINIADILIIKLDTVKTECGPDGMSVEYGNFTAAIRDNEIEIPVTAEPNTELPLKLPMPGPLPDIELGSLTLNYQNEETNEVAAFRISVAEEIPGSPISGSFVFSGAKCC